MAQRAGCCRELRAHLRSGLRQPALVAGMGSGGLINVSPTCPNSSHQQQQAARCSAVPSASSPRHRRIEKVWERKINFSISQHGPGQEQAGASMRTVSAGSVQKAPLPSTLQRSHFRPVMGNFILHLDCFRGKNKLVNVPHIPLSFAVVHPADYKP